MPKLQFVNENLTPLQLSHSQSPVFTFIPPHLVHSPSFNIPPLPFCPPLSHRVCNHLVTVCQSASEPTICPLGFRLGLHTLTHTHTHSHTEGVYTDLHGRAKLIHTTV